jgi:hypothetical protein
MDPSGAMYLAASNIVYGVRSDSPTVYLGPSSINVQGDLVVQASAASRCFQAAFR